MKKHIIIPIFFLIVFLPSIVLSADYILKKGVYVYSSSFQVKHIEDLGSETGVGYITDQLDKGLIVATGQDRIVKIIDSCTFCRANWVKVKSTDGKGEGWVLKSDLTKVKSKK